MCATQGWLLHVECYQKALAAPIAVLHLQMLCSHIFASAGRKCASSQGDESLFICAGLICCVFAELCKIPGVSVQCSRCTASNVNVCA